MGRIRTDSERTRAVFRVVNPLMVAMWRLGLGPVVNIWPRRIGQIMILGHRGRRSGLRRWTPLNYAWVDGAVCCTAGIGSTSDWYRNVRRDSEVEVWLPTERLIGVVHEVTDEPRRLAILRQVLLASGFAAGAAGLDPHGPDAELAAATAAYRVIRIEPNADRLPEHPRPGDRAGVALAVTVAAVLRSALWGRTRRRCRRLSRLDSMGK